MSENYGLSNRSQQIELARLNLTYTVMKSIVSDSCDPPDGPVMRTTMRGIIEETLTKLRPIARDIVQRRLGLGGREMDTLSEIGRIYRLTRQRIRQMLQTAL